MMGSENGDLLKNTNENHADNTTEHAGNALCRLSYLERDSNFELLRILAILFIISFHCAWEGGFEYPAFCFNKFLLYFYYPRLLSEYDAILFRKKVFELRICF